MTTNEPYVLASLAVWIVWMLGWHLLGRWHGARVAAAPLGLYGWQLGIAAIGFLCLFAGSPRVRSPLWLLPPALGWAAVGLVAGGALFAFWARFHLGRLWSGGVEAREDHRLVRSGPYAHVRHPIYTGLIAAALGLALAKATPLALVGAALLALGFALKARVEERFLAAQLGEADYEEYRRAVPMLIPSIRFR